MLRTKGSVVAYFYMILLIVPMIFAARYASGIALLELNYATLEIKQTIIENYAVGLALSCIAAYYSYRKLGKF